MSKINKSARKRIKQEDAEIIRRISAEKLREFCQAVLVRVGLSASDAEILSDSLVESNLRGVDSHGVVRLSHYVKAMKEGSISTAPKLKMRRVAPSGAILDADHGPGQVAALKAMEEAIRLARKTGVGLVGVKNSGHFGAAAYFAMQALNYDMIGIATTQVEADMVPFGAKKPYLGNSPIAIAVPANKELPIVLDMATSTVTYGKILLAAQEGKEIPSDWGVDKEGSPTTDPKKVRGLYPMSGHKGYGLALVLDVLAGILFGSPFGPYVKGIYFSPSVPQTIGHLLAAINISVFVPVERFKSTVDRMIKEIKALEPAKGFNEVLLPGEKEARTKKKRLEEGIPLEEGICSELRSLGEEWKVELPAELR